jgi:SAM-dependent methyltransferase
MAAWFDDDDLWATVAPKIFDARRWGDAEAEVDHLLDLVGVAPGARILDMPCGTGRHLLELARRGFRVTGVDRTEAFLRDVRAAADAESLEVELVRQDMRAFSREGAFDLGLNLYTSFGYFVDPEDDLKVLERFHRSLVPGGRLVIETISKEILARDLRPRDWREDEDGSLWLEEREIRSGWDWIDNRWIFIGPDGGRREHHVAHRLYSAAELSALCRRAGFAGVATHGDLTGRPYDPDAVRLVVVARKG